MTSLLLLAFLLSCGRTDPIPEGPNFLFVITDDQSWLHAGAYGDKVVKTPVLDQLADGGVRFNHAYTAVPSCTPSRAAIATGQEFWRLGSGGTLWSSLDAKHPVYPDLLEAHGYHVGFTVKGWGPGDVKAAGRTRNAAGWQYSDPKRFIGKAGGRPWALWMGTKDPHRPYEEGAGVRRGMDTRQVEMPPVWPDTEATRSEVADYLYEIEHFDSVLGEVIDYLSEIGELDDTIVVYTSDNGIPMPRGKATLYDLGTRMPLVVSWPDKVKGGRVVDDMVSLTDVAPTFLEAAGLPIPREMTGRSLMTVLLSDKDGLVDPKRTQAFFGIERHGWSRAGGLGYPSRAIRVHDYLYIHNYESDRWPAGDPPCFPDVDPWDFASKSATKEYLVTHPEDPLHALAFGKRPAEELYDTRVDPYQVHNVASEADYQPILSELRGRLVAYQKETGDPRETGGPMVWDASPYYGSREAKTRPGSPVTRCEIQ